VTAGAKNQLVVVTGLSGAGKSTALHTLEDLGFFCVDNLPTLLAPQAVELCEKGGMTRIALGMDVRVRTFLGALENVTKELATGERDVEVLFLDASDEALLRRFNETRRPHPLATLNENLSMAVLDGIAMERERLAPLRALAGRVIDTTRLSVHELRRAIVGHFSHAGAAPRMNTRVVSFGFKYGAPVDADLVFDVRFLDNPFFVEDLKALPGTDPRVAKFVMDNPETSELVAKTRDLLLFSIPKYEREGKSQLTIAVGCTGGRHRSVVIAEALASAIRATNAPVSVVHRDVDRGEKR
jgi:UPF0042 nucleotide-binding protein